MECEEEGLTQLITDIIAKVGGHEEFEACIVHRLKKINCFQYQLGNSQHSHMI